MRTINIRITKENINGKDMFFSRYELLKMAINNPAQGGFSIEEMQKRIRLMNKINECKDEFDIKESDFNESHLDRKATIELEDADYQKLKELFREVKWGIVSQSIVDFASEIDK